MPTQKHKPPRQKTGGRQPGTANKLTSTAKETISQCASMLEANGRTLYQWVIRSEENERAFWVQIYPKLLPLQLTGAGGGPLIVCWLNPIESGKSDPLLAS